MVRAYSKRKNTIQSVLSRFVRVFLAIWFNFIGYLQKIAMKNLTDVCRAPMPRKNACA